MTAPPAPRPTALITGASAGIGRALAKVFASHGHDVVLLARDAYRLESLASECRESGAAATVVVADLALPASPHAVFSRLQETTIDVLVNNAGLGTYGEFASIDWQDQLRLLQVNIFALTHLTRLFLPPMLARGHGKILNVASAAAFQPGPLMATYFASKAYVLYLSEAIAQEVAGRGITVTAFCPGPVRTEFRTRAGSEGKRIFSGAAEPAEIAVIGYHGLMRGRRVVIPGVRTRILSVLPRLVPRRLMAWAAGRANKVS